MIGCWTVLATLAAAQDGAEISRSRGPRDGVVLLSPRLVPPTEDPVLLAIARAVQERVATSVRAASGPDTKVVLRPAPERVCPLQGCRSASVGLVLGHDGGGCAVVAVVGPPGPVDQSLVALAGDVDLGEGPLPFRTAPESRITVRELVPCSEVADRLDPVALEPVLTAAR